MVAFVLGAVPFLLALQATQPSSASIVGTVRDAETGGPLAGATVVLPELDRLVVTGADGRYLLRHVAAGPQHVAVRFIGHAPRTLHALVPPAGQVEINVSLVALPHRLAALEVRTPIAVRGLDSDGSTVFPDRAASIAAVVNHPLAAEPDVFQALSGGEVQQRPETPEGMHIRGGESDQTSYLLDGVPVFSPYHAAGVSSARIGLPHTRRRQHHSGASHRGRSIGSRGRRLPDQRAIRDAGAPREGERTVVPEGRNTRLARDARGTRRKRPTAIPHV